MDPGSSPDDKRVVTKEFKNMIRWMIVIFPVLVCRCGLDPKSMNPNFFGDLRSHGSRVKPGMTSVWSQKSSKT